MALYSTLLAGSQITWKASGGTHVLTLTSLASGSARQGDKGSILDANGNIPEVIAFLLTTKMASAIANATNKLSLLIGESDSSTAGTDNPAGLTGADGSLGTPAEYTLQLALAQSMNLSNNASTNSQSQWLSYYPTQSYIIPVVYNQSDQALSGTAGDHLLTAIPYYRVQRSF